MAGRARRNGIRGPAAGPGLLQSGIVEVLDTKGVEFTYHDPHVACFSHQGKTWRSQSLSEGVPQAQDLILILTDHGSVDYDFVAKHSAFVFDTRNVVASLREPHPSGSVL